jgi:membrane-associated phospholipid phosphatase
VDHAVYAAIARTPTPSLDRALGRLSEAANYSRLWLASSLVLAGAGGARGRRAAADGMLSIAAGSVVVNAAIKPLGRRRRPDRVLQEVPVGRHVPMPKSTSFPSGHSASAFAFATAVGLQMPQAAVPLRALAALVAYSRVHTGVHYPGDVVFGSLLGSSVAQLTTRGVERVRS